MKYLKTFESFNIRNFEDTPLYKLNRAVYLYYLKNDEDFKHSSQEEFERDLLSKVSEIIPENIPENISNINNDDIYNINADTKEVWLSDENEVLGEIWSNDENAISSYWIKK